MIKSRLVMLGLFIIALIGGTFVVASSLPAPEPDAGPKERLGLMTSLPIYWNESGDLDGMLDADQSAHWVRTQLEEDFDLVPLDVLARDGSAEPSEDLAGLERLLLAQPRTLPAADFAALDSWVRGGGRLLMFADPMLTEHSDFGFGDKRRPQDVAMLSPILTRWGLSQLYDEDQDGAARSVMSDTISLPIRKAGRFELAPADGATCYLSSGGVIATCDIGQGRVVIVADAALLDREGDLEVASKALDRLVLTGLR